MRSALLGSPTIVTQARGIRKRWDVLSGLASGQNNNKTFFIITMADIKCLNKFKKARFFALINYNKRILIFRFKKALFIKINFNKLFKYRVFKLSDLRTFYN
jgi:hypothetical protein